MGALIIPRSLAVRIFLIMAGGIIASTFLSRWLIEEVYSNELERLGRNAAVERISDVIRVLDALPRGLRPAAAKGIAFERLTVEWPDRLEPAHTVDDSVPALVAQGIRRQPGPLRFEARSPKPCDQTRDAECKAYAKRFAIELALADGQPVRIEYTTRWIKLDDIDYVSWIIGICAVVLVVWISMRLTIRPLRELADHADGLGRDVRRAPLDENGPTEVRHAARAFNAMQAQIRRQIDERAQMLAAIAHDLKTPLTRLRLRIEQVDDDALRARLGGDLDAMRMLIDEGLELARSLESTESPQRIDVSAMLDSLCEDTREAGGIAHFLGEEGCVLEARANALRRIVLNLIDNAVKYGGNADVSIGREGFEAVVRVRDHGPGIPPAHLDDVLKPYFRLDASRSRETGGTGLGLAITANLVAVQRGRLSLSNLPEGGLLAEVRLPIAAC